MTTTEQAPTASEQTEKYRLRIIGAAINQFLTRGFPESSIEEIITDSGVEPDVARGLFPSKYDVLKVLGDLNKMAATGMLDGVTAEAELPPNDEIIARVADFFESMVASGAPAGIAPQAMGLSLFDQGVNAIMQDVIEGLRASWVRLALRMAAEGRLADDVEPEDVAATFFTLVIGFMTSNMLADVSAGNLRRGLRAVLA
ncbi:MAG: TetR/AcrR family transcriptional regulator [Catenulispora sp.]